MPLSSHTQSELNLKTIINNTRYNIFLVDRDLKFIEFNQSFKQEFDLLYKADLKIGDSAVDAPIPPEVCADWKQFYKEAFSGNKLIRDYEFGGEPYIITLNPVLDQGVVTGIAVFSENMTREHELKRSIEESRFLFKFAMDVTNSGFWNLDLATNTFYVSDVFKKMLAYESSEMQLSFKTWLQLIHPDDLQEVESEMNKHKNRETEVFAVEMRMRCKDGNYRWILSKGRLTSIVTGQAPLSIIGVNIDIDQLKQTEQDLKRRNLQLREIAYIASYGVRKSLSNILGLSSLMSPGDSLTSLNKDMINKIMTSAQELNAETNRLGETIRNMQIELFSFSEKPHGPVNRIMIVDDDSINNIITKVFFEKANVKTQSFVNPVEAFDTLKDNKRSYDLIMLDINMPVMDGWKFLQQMTLEKIETPVIILTSSIFNSDKEKASGFRNVIDYWIKPLTKSKIEKLLNTNHSI